MTFSTNDMTYWSDVGQQQSESAGYVKAKLIAAPLNIQIKT